MTLHTDVPVCMTAREMAFNQDVKALLARPGVDSRFLAYWLLGNKPLLLALVDPASHGTGRIHTNVLQDVQMLLPPPGEQAAIAEILGALDDKIELNRRMNETLDALAWTMFKSTFIDPSRIRDEWEWGSVADLARYVNGRNFTKEATGSGRMVIRIAELNSGPGPATVYSDVEAHEENIAREGDILFSWSGSLGVYRWHRDEALINQHIFKVIPARYPAWFVFFHLRNAMPFFRDIASDKATTMGHIKREHLAQAPLALPPQPVTDAMSGKIAPLYDMTGALARQSRTLSQLRDALLPKLISGEIRVREAENLVEEVA